MKKSVLVSRILLGALTIAIGIFFILHAWSYWQPYIRKGYQGLPIDIANVIILAIPFLLLAALLFIKDRVYIHKTVRILALIYAATLGLACILGIAASIVGFYLYSVGGSYNGIALLVALIILGINFYTGSTCFILFQRIRQAGWFRKYNGSAAKGAINVKLDSGRHKVI